MTSPNSCTFRSKFYSVVASILVGSVLSAFAQQDLFTLDSSNPNVVWKIKPQAEWNSDGVTLSQLGLNSSDWIKAEVPGTVFGSCVNAGLEKDPNFGDNIYQVDRKKYDQNFWYRTEFTVPASFAGKTVWLNFAGLNKSGDIYLNGKKLGSLWGFMDRGHYDITELIHPGQSNALAVLVNYPSEKRIANFGSPTYMSCAGWDWMPRVPGLLSGITDKVYLTTSGAVTLADPWIRTKLESNSSAHLNLNVTLENHSNIAQKGTLTGIIQPGDIQFSKEVEVPAGQTLDTNLNDKDFPQLTVSNPKLWWPNGYGAPNLYTCEMKFVCGGGLSDVTKFNFGIREYSYDTEGDVLHISINGKRIFVKGGNWGMSEYMLRCRGAEYDLKVRLHQDMHMNMIRNWLGSTTDGEFYDACDKYGIMVWDDFWLNSMLGIPGNKEGLNQNAIDKIKRFRNHACIAVWCGENEGVPGAPMDDWFKQDVATYDGNDRRYQSNSHAGSLTGSGVWANMDPAQYFTKYPLGFGGNKGWGFRTEIGTAVFTTFESFKKFMPQESWWPRNEMWNRHFFGKSAPNGGSDRYEKSINDRYGTATGIEDFCRKAQLLNIETNKAMYEGWLDNMWNDSSGIMTWMSQSAYPSLVWQTYDYYYDLNGAYWGVKSACEPIHIQWNQSSNAIKVINTSSDDLKGISAEATVYNKDGSQVPSLSNSQMLDAPSNTATECFRLNFNPGNLAFKKKTTASSTSPDAAASDAVTDGATGTRWSSIYSNNQWIYVDLGKVQQVGCVHLNWDGAYAKSYEIQISNDALNWQTVYSTLDSKGGLEDLIFTPVTTRYVKMNGLKRATGWGISLREFEIYSEEPKPFLSDVHFIKLTLKDSSGHFLSDNFYWRGEKSLDYTGLNTLPKVNLQVETKMDTSGNRVKVTSQITNPNSSSAIAFAVHVRLVRAKDDSRILPVFMNDNYFSLIKGESKEVTMTFDSSLLGQDNPKVIVEPYNNEIFR